MVRVKTSNLHEGKRWDEGLEISKLRYVDEEDVKEPIFDAIACKVFYGVVVILLVIMVGLHLV